MKRTPSSRSAGNAPAGVRASAGLFGGGIALFALTALAFSQAGCSSEPLSSDLSTLLPETERALVGYNETDYVYPVRVPNTNRYVQMRVKEPLGYEPTYDDYLKWKEGK